MYVKFKDSMVKYCVYDNKGNCIKALFKSRKEAENFIKELSVKVKLC
jgi:hypothetical protein